MLLLNKRFKMKKGDLKQIAVVSSSTLGFVPFTVYTSLKVIDRDFKYQKYDKWEASMTYVWRLIP